LEFAMNPYLLDKSRCVHHEIYPGVHIYTSAAGSMMVSLVEMKPGSVVKEHSHPHEQVGYLIEGTGEFTIGGHTRTVGPGDMWKIPPHVPHSLVAGAAPVRAFDVFCPVREDYL
jgi:quercetin dioxygenase-like cupin family protein